MSYTFSLSRRSLPVRCLCLLLIVLVLWCFFMVPQASAVALEATTIAYGGLLIGTILVGAGVVFSSHGDMVKVGNAMYKTLVNGSSAIGNTISSISAWAVEHGKAIGEGALRVGKDLYQAIVDAFNASYADGVFSVTGQDFYVSSLSAVPAFAESFLALRATGFTGALADGTKVDGQIVADHSSGYWEYSYTYYLGERKITGSLDTFSSPQQFFFYFDSSTNNWAWLKIGRVNSDGTLTLELKSIHIWDENLVPFSISVVDGITIPAPDLAYPSDDYLVKMPDIPSVDAATGEATFPADAAYTKDAVAVPYPVDADGVKVPDIPYDKVVDQSTGKTLDDTDTGTDTDNPSKPGEGADTGSNTSLLQKILDLLKNFFDSPSDFRLNMDGFRNLAIADKFPFCIPFDLVDSIKQFAVTAKDFHFRIKLDTHYFQIDHEVDLSDMVLPFAFFRYMVLVWFVWTLMLRTRDLVKW